MLKAVCARDEAKAKAFADKWGYESVETDWKKLLARKDIDAVDICTPNNLHKEIAIAAAQAGKMILCEKPLAMNAAEGEEMCQAVEKAGVPNIVWYNYRRVPAVTFAKQIDRRGASSARSFTTGPTSCRTGRSRADLPQGGQGLWRLDVGRGRQRRDGRSAGPLHRHGHLAQRRHRRTSRAMTETFIKERKHNLTGKVEKVGIDDACAFLCRFANGSLGLFESTRYARGHKALYTFEINGEKASHQVGPARPAPPAVLRPPRRRPAPRLAEHPRHRRRPSLHGQVVGAGPADRLRARSFVHQVADFLDGLAKGKPAGPTFRDALETQKICDAVLASAKSGAWTKVG